jgi:hypothetical protein
LRTFKATELQKRFFSFKLPSFATTDGLTGTRALVRTVQEDWRAMIYLRAGVTALLARDMAEGQVFRSNRRALRQVTATSVSASRRAPAFLAWDALHRRVHVALSCLEKREKTAWRRLDICRGL